MRKIRVLVVDDSALVRRIISDALACDPEIEVAATAANGRIALARIPQVNPDVITLDVEMPVMDGLEALKELRKTYLRLPVIMFSTLTERGASATLDALALGASDYVTKPSNVGGAAVALQRIREDLIPKIKAHSTAVRAPIAFPARHTPFKAPFRATQAPGFRLPGRRVELVAIGVSTGGPNALAELIPQLPQDFPVPVVIVQHMPPIFTKFLADRLSSKAQIHVDEARTMQEVVPGQAYIAPGDFHMVVTRENGTVRIRTHQGPPENSCRPAVDVLFRSVAEAYREHALGVIMTGMGQDGLRGCQSIYDAGGQILAQDAATSVVWGMPGFVANAGLADKVLPLEQLASEIIQKVSRGRPSGHLVVDRPHLESR
ncbi:MAG: chemotaxis response regulator protein-glutamate methylesterase [Acidobacteriota bacterium]